MFEVSFEIDKPLFIRWACSPIRKRAYFSLLAGQCLGFGTSLLFLGWAIWFLQPLYLLVALLMGGYCVWRYRITPRKKAEAQFTAIKKQLLGRKWNRTLVFGTSSLELTDNGQTERFPYHRFTSLSRRKGDYILRMGKQEAIRFPKGCFVRGAEEEFCAWFSGKLPIKK
ncbi:MAG: YcxB family protein [Clostridia bacterium]|nr:YcxB family protein [Clostridia bacterium]